MVATEFGNKGIIGGGWLLGNKGLGKWFGLMWRDLVVPSVQNLELQQLWNLEFETDLEFDQSRQPGIPCRANCRFLSFFSFFSLFFLFFVFFFLAQSGSSRCNSSTNNPLYLDPSPRFTNKFEGPSKFQELRDFVTKSYQNKFGGLKIFKIF